MLISILIVTHNAPDYVRETIESLNEVTDPVILSQCEIIVVDNQSDIETKQVLQELHDKKYINTLYFSKENTWFAGGNNLAASLASKNADMFLLLNSDIQIRRKDWLEVLLQKKSRNNADMISFGTCYSPLRCDGYCLLIDSRLYMKLLLDEKWKWWGAVTKLNAQVLKEGRKIVTIPYHEKYIYHYGGKSGNSFKKIDNCYGPEISEIKEWFNDYNGHINEIFLSHFDFFNVKILQRIISTYKNQIAKVCKKLCIFQ